MAKTFREKYNEAKARLASRGRAAHGHAMKAKPYAIAGAGGAGAYYVGKFAADRVDFVKNNWYGRPIAMVGAALLVAKKNREAALGMAGAAGYEAARAHDAMGGSSGGSAPSFSTKGYDAGMVENREAAALDTGAFVDGDAGTPTEIGAPDDYVLAPRRRRPPPTRPRPDVAGKPAARGSGR